MNTLYDCVFYVALSGGGSDSGQEDEKTGPGKVSWFSMYS